MRVRIPDNKKYARALDILFQGGGLFWTRPTHVLIVTLSQFEALVNAGIVPPKRIRASRGKKKKPLELDLLNRVRDDLRLPSLAQTPATLSGHAFRFKLILPRLSQKARSSIHQ